MNKIITEFSDLELKALAYENIKVRDNAQNNINLIEQELLRRAQEAKKISEQVIE